MGSTFLCSLQKLLFKLQFKPSKLLDIHNSGPDLAASLGHTYNQHKVSAKWDPVSKILQNTRHDPTQEPPRITGTDVELL